MIFSGGWWKHKNGRGNGNEGHKPSSGKKVACWKARVGVANGIAALIMAKKM
jgi:hypothetical protein